MLCVAIETRIDISESQPGVSCINVAYGVILLSNCIISETQHLWLRRFTKNLWKNDRVHYEEVIFVVLVSKLKLNKISTCFTCLTCLNNGNTRTMCQICLNLSIKAPEWRDGGRFGVFSFNVEQISDIFMVF